MSSTSKSARPLRSSDVPNEPLDPEEIRVALHGLRDLMRTIRSTKISTDLKLAYDRIANISVSESSLN